MPDRTRPIRKEICLNEQELNLIQHKMRQLGTHNFGAYARKMLIDGYIIKVDYTEQKKLAAAVSRAASNINQICRRINSTGHVYEDDVAELKARQTEIWELLLRFQILHCGIHQLQLLLRGAGQLLNGFQCLLGLELRQLLRELLLRLL